MQLSFYAKGRNLVAANTITGPNQIRKYAGRTRRSEKIQDPRNPQNTVTRYSYVATQEPFTVDKNTDLGRKLMRAVRREGSLWPADQETAKACGVSFKQVLFDGENWNTPHDSLLELGLDSELITTSTLTGD